MLLTEVVPHTREVIDAGSDAGRRRLNELYAVPPGPFLRLNMIASLTGAAVGPDGTSDTLTGGADRTVLGAVRRAADVVLVGAQSVRVEGYAVPRSARLAVVTTSGDLTGHGLRPTGADADQVLILCPADRADALATVSEIAGVTVVPIEGPGPLHPSAILAALRGRGLERIVCEGGPALASTFAAAGLIDEYCVTTAPVLGPAAAPFLTLSASTAPVTRVAGHLVDDAGFSYLRLRRR